MSLGPDDLVLCAGTLFQTPFLERLAPAQAAGFAGVSMLSADYDALAAAGYGTAEIRARVADAGLGIAEFDPIGLWLPEQVPHPGMAAWLSDMLMTYTAERLCPIAEALGARSISVVEMFGVPVDLDRAAESFVRICDRARNHGLLVHLEFVPFGGIADLGTGWEIIRRADCVNGGLMVDSWHLFRGGSTLDELARIPGAKILGLQIDDAPAKAEADLLEETSHRRLLPGDGAFDLVGFLRTLKAIGCPAPLGVEIFSDALAGLPPAEIARRSAEATRRLMIPREEYQI